MMIEIYAVNQTTGEQTLICERCRLHEAIETDDPLYCDALDAIEATGEYVIGGGAAAMSILRRVP